MFLCGNFWGMNVATDVLKGQSQSEGLLARPLVGNAAADGADSGRLDGAQWGEQPSPSSPSMPPKLISSVTLSLPLPF